MATIDRLYAMALVSYNRFKVLAENRDYPGLSRELEWLKEWTNSLKKYVLGLESEASSPRRSKTCSFMEDSDMQQKSIDLIKKNEEHVESLGLKIFDDEEKEITDMKSPHEDPVDFEDGFADDFNIDDFLYKN